MRSFARRLRSIAGGVCCAVLAGAPPAPVQAHGSPPEALAVTAIDAEQRPLVVRVNEGLARRSGDVFRFVCPAVVGEELPALAESAPGGPVFLGTRRGLFVLQDDGSAAQHPDPEASGRIAALSASPAAVFALRGDGRAGTRTEVLRVEPSRIEVVWSDDRAWDDLDISDDRILLVRLAESRLHAVRLSPDGDLDSDQSVAVPETTIAVVARAAGARPYVVLLDSSLEVTLGRVEPDGFVPVLTAQTLGGPLLAADGHSYIARNGELSRFDDEQLEPLQAPGPVTCLRRRGALEYACSDRGLHPLAPDAGLGGPLFELTQLREPELASVPEPQREACRLQWQRYRIDLLGIGVEAPALDAGAPDAGAAATRPDAAVDAGQPSPTRDRGSAGGCAVAGRDRSPRGARPAWPVLAWISSWAAACVMRRRGGALRRTSRSIRRSRTDRRRPFRRRRTS